MAVPARNQMEKDVQRALCERGQASIIRACQIAYICRWMPAALQGLPSRKDGRNGQIDGLAMPPLLLPGPHGLEGGLPNLAREVQRRDGWWCR